MVSRRVSNFRVSPRPVNGDRSLPRDYTNSRNRGALPSLEFDWGRALYLQARTFQQLGYTLTTEQQKRIDDHEQN